MSDIDPNYLSSVDPQMEEELRSYARQIFALVMWPSNLVPPRQDRISPLVDREVDKLSIEDLLSFKEQIADIVKKIFQEKNNSATIQTDEETLPNKRESGFYWVKHVEEWTIGRWYKEDSPNGWTDVLGLIEGNYKDSDFDEIGSIILNPHKP